MPDLQELFHERASARSFKLRNAAYRLFDSTYQSEDIERPVLDLSYRPNNVDGVQIGDDNELRKIVINQVRRVVNHFGAMFSHRPRFYVLPSDLDTDRHEWQSEYLEFVAVRSNLDAKHAQQSHYLSLRGDAVFGIDWNPVEGVPPGIYIRTFDPHKCYPLFSPTDLGAVEDMLIAYQVHPGWAERRFGVKGLRQDQMAHIFYYWDDESFHLQVEETPIPRAHRTFDIGVCPFRWVFGDASGTMAQADCREVPKLQEIYNEGLLLSIDAIRKQVDPAWWATNISKDVQPEPGTVTALPEGSDIGAWPVQADPQIILGVMEYLEQSIQATTGVSPISVHGQAQGGRVTGPGVRHQVEAADARSETRKVLLQATYARMGELILRVANMEYPEEMIRFLSRGGGVQQRQGQEFERNSLCGAEYSDFVSNTPEQRFQIAMQGLGRLWDLDYAIGNVMNLPGTNPKDMARKIREYQVEQAKIQADAQQEAQKIAQGPESGGATPGTPSTLQRPQRPSPPSTQALRRALAASTGASNGFRR